MNSTPVTTLPEISFLTSLPSGDILTLVFYILIAFYAIFTGILYYHWNAYSSSKTVTTATYLAYAAITLPLLTILTSSLYLI